MTTVPPADTARILSVVLGAVILLAAACEVRAVYSEDYEETFTFCPLQRPYIADIEIGRVHYAEESRTFVGTLRATVRSTQRAESPTKTETLGAVTIRHPNSVGGESARWLPRCATQHVVVSDNGQFVGGIDLDCGIVELAPSQAGQEWKYPFDEYTIQFEPRACVGLDVCTADAQNVTVAALRISAMQRNFIMESGDEPGAIVLRRYPLVRIATPVLFLMACVSICYLWGAGQRTQREMFADSLGLFAALWAFRIFLVPNSVPTFPTLVDYAVLCTFAGAFVVLLYKTPREGRS